MNNAAENKLTDKGCISSPDMIIEVVSPFNLASDYIRKLNLLWPI